MCLSKVVTSRAEMDSRAEKGEFDKAFDLLGCPLLWNHYLRQAESMLSHDDAQEILQDTILATYKGRSNWKQKGKFSTWFYGSLRNNALSKLGYNSRRKGSELGDMDNPEDFCARKGHYNEPKINGDELQYADKILSELKPEFQEVLCLRAKGYSHKEIAEAADIPAATSQTRTFYAMREFRMKATRIGIEGKHFK